MILVLGYGFLLWRNLNLFEIEITYLNSAN